VFDKGTPALDGQGDSQAGDDLSVFQGQDPTGRAIDLLIYLPAGAKKPVPMFFSINFGAVQNAVERSGGQAGDGVGSEDERRG
jgi:hypothetical protein